MKATAVFLLALVFCGCGNGGPAKPAIANSALIGKWVRAIEIDAGTGTGGKLYEDGMLELAADGTTTSTYTGEVNCNGSQVYNGGTWSATTTTLIFAGTSSCSGTITCTVAGIPGSTSCDGTTLDLNFSVSYALSGDNNTLTISSAHDGGTTTTAYTRH